MCYLDRINVGFAALTMNKDIGLDAAIYGMAAGAFFWGYVLAEVPSNIILEKVGARIWIARIMITWGIISGCTAFATGPYSFMAIRFLLGLAEAGLVPRFRALFHLLVPRRATAPASIPASPWPCRSRSPPARRSRPRCLGSTGCGACTGWQVMYILEAIPTVLIGVVVFFYLTDRPAKAHWLDRRAARLAANRRIAGERRQIEAAHGVGLLRSFWDPKVMMLSLNYIGIVTASLGMLLFLPTIIKELGISNMQVGWVTMIPYTCGAISDGVLRLAVRPDRRAALDPVLDLRALGRRADHRRADDRHVVVGGRHVDRGGRVLRHQGSVLVDADDVPDRRRGRVRHRLDQLARQSRRVFRPVASSAGRRTSPAAMPAASMPWRPVALVSAMISLFWLRIPKAVVASEEPGVVPAE